MQLNVFTAIQMDDVDFLKEFLLQGVLPEDGLISGAIDHTRCLRFLLEEFPHLINRAYGHRLSQLRLRRNWRSESTSICSRYPCVGRFVKHKN